MSCGENTLWIVGPCSVESRGYFLKAAEFLYKTFEGRDFFLKGSFDKANRTSVYGKRGPGLEESIDIFRETKEAMPGVKIITDVHETHQVEKLAGVVDAIQIPAFLCRQTDLLQECGKNFKDVNVKKGQWIDPHQTAFFAEKIKSKNPDTRVWITERGTFFGYGNLIVDFNAAGIMREYCDHLIIDCTHSTQHKEGQFTSGSRSLAEKYLMASIPFSYTGIFIETHFEPSKATSDGDCMVLTQRIPKLLKVYDKMSQIYKNENGEGADDEK
ncbi:3-deoxy-8-phosphooctulonate synthase [uncultured Desulfobacter sp.]|uniref:3-deoxy-8-phosphooctulonate synthase n=1 Tax=uncultured Desulfobacter sp. TaxID=240139 RepID=UPI002AAB85E3|nr:3-deoxy-8-phosphooctulonate synthase [uncultured Desulfobacter sp.]